MYPLAKSDILKKVSRYVLSRGSADLEISVEHVLSGPAAGKFHSEGRIDGHLIDVDFWGSGQNEGAALRDLLERIKGVPFRRLLPPG